MNARKVNLLLWELVAAHRTARREDLTRALDACGLRQQGGPIFGVELVAIDGHNYAPEPGGQPALILPYFEDGRLLDLVACRFTTRTCSTRDGICTALGAEHIERARDAGTALSLFADPVEWLLADRQGACVVDWRSAHFTLADLDAGIACSSNLLAARVQRAMQRPATVPPLFVREAAHAA